MLEAMRRHSRSLIIYLIFGILIAVFILTFGPQQGQSSPGGCTGSPSQHVAVVGGQEISDVSWRFALLTAGYGSASGARARQMRAREKVMDGLIERELLAQAAEKHGFRLSSDDVEKRIAKGEFYLLGSQQPGQYYFFSKDDGVEEPYFDIKKLESFVKAQGLGSVDMFIEEQKREMLAQKMRELLITSVRVSPDEVKQKFVEDHSNVVVDFVKFEPLRMRDSMEVTPAEIDAYAAAHEAELKKKYETDASRYKGRGKEVRLRHIFITRTPEEDEPAPAPAPAPGAPPAPAPAPKDKLPDPKLARAQAALNKLKGGADFAALAREYSEDERSKARGGDTGWRPAAALGFGGDFASAVDKLETGKAPEAVIETLRGYHIVRVEGRREGDLTFDQVKRDLAEEAAREDKARTQARAAAEKALADARAGTPLDKQFEPMDRPDGPTTPPAPVDPAKPKLVSQAEIKRNGVVLGGGSGKYIGRSAELTRALFQELEPDSLGPKVYEVDGSLVIVKLVSRAEPDFAKLPDERHDIEESLRGEKAYRVLQAYTDQRCHETKDDIAVVKQYIEYSEVDEKTGKPKDLPVTWAPCAGDAAMILGGAGSPFELEP